MDANFYDQYKDYSTVELLKIITRREDYQAAAIEAAERVLQERQVTEAEREEAEGFFKERESERQEESARMEGYKKQVTGLLEPVLKPGAGLKPQKWLLLFLIVFGIQYAIGLYSFISLLIKTLRCETCPWVTVVIWPLINIVYQTVVFYLLLKVNRWGWVVLLVDSIFSVIMRMGELDIFFKYRQYHHGDADIFLFSLFLKVAFVVFLWRKEISHYFGVTDKMRGRAARVGVVLGLGFVCWARFM